MERAEVGGTLGGRAPLSQLREKSTQSINSFIIDSLINSLKDGTHGTHVTWLYDRPLTFIHGAYNNFFIADYRLNCILYNGVANYVSINNDKLID